MQQSFLVTRPSFFIDTMSPTNLSRYALVQVENHFNEMKGDVGMSSHEKEREQKDVYQSVGRRSM